MRGQTVKPQRQQSNNSANRFQQKFCGMKQILCLLPQIVFCGIVSKWNEASVEKLCCVLLAEWSRLTDRLHTNGGPRGDRRGV